MGARIAIRTVTVSAAYEPHIVGLSGSLYLTYHSTDVIGIAGDDHDLQTIVILQVGVQLGLYRIDVFCLDKAHPGIGMVMTYGDEDALYETFHLIEVFDLGPGRIEGCTHRIAPALQPIDLLDMVELLHVFIVQRYTYDRHYVNLKFPTWDY